MKASRILAGLLLALAIGLAACGNRLPPHIAVQFATPTPTPFLPGTDPLTPTVDKEVMAETATQFVTETVNYAPETQEDNSPWGDYPAPTMLSDVAIPMPAPKIAQPDGQVTILILGSDQRPGDGGFRTDVILLLTLNPELGRVNLTSLPRDLYVYQPGHRVERINSTQSRGGFELTALTFEYNFGFRPDHWVMVNFDGFRQIVDSLGGIEVNVAQALTDQRDGHGDFSVAAGPMLMDSETALWYVRSRGTTSDFDRARRQQEVLKALFLDSFSLDVFKNANAAELYQAYRNTVTTDLGFGDILQLLPLAAQVYGSQEINSYAIGANEVNPWITSGNAQVLMPDREAVGSVFAAALNSE